ncbi:MAG: DUF4920 domain-containing protein [Chitinophagaceae bacterium]|nr:DUF4920 domain-containing protein [Chitinophagaceae bacterium]
MKRVSLLFIVPAIVFSSCQSGNTEQAAEETHVVIIDSSYGESFDKKGAVTVSQFNEQMAGKDSLDNIIVEGDLSEVCQAMGCWVKLKNESGEDIFVKMRGHDFFVPKDVAGKHVFLKGTGIREVTTVEELQHYAEDAGESEEAIAAITEPKEELKIDASGVIIEHVQE